MKPPLELFSLERKGRPSCRVAFSFCSSQSANFWRSLRTENRELRTCFGTECLYPYNTVYRRVSLGRELNVLRSLWCAVASGRATLRTLRQNRAGTHRAATEPGSRACTAGRHSVDGLLRVVRCRRSRAAGGGADDFRRYVPHPRRSVAGGHGLAAASSHLYRMFGSGNGRDRLLHRLGLAAAGGVGAIRCSGGGLLSPAENPAWHSARHLHALGAAALAIRRRVQSVGTGRVACRHLTYHQSCLRIVLLTNQCGAWNAI